MHDNTIGGISIFSLLYSGFAITINAVLSIDGDTISTVIAWAVGVSAVVNHAYAVYTNYKKNKRWKK